MPTITTHELKKKWAQVNRELSRISVRNTINGKSDVTTTGNNDVTTSKVTIETVTITKVQGDYLISDKGVKAQLFSPMPCLYWKCTGTPDSKEVISLQKPLKALFLNDGANIYCLGVSGASDEFEVRFHVGSNEVRINNDYLNLCATHIVQNGLEITNNE